MSLDKKNILDYYPSYEVVIGIEIHVQLCTNSKLFCSCPNSFGETPNKNICPTCAGYPGTLPVLNKKAVDYAIKAGLATNCKITRVTDFARKHYVYPDLPKNFQITQDDRPICQEGYVPIELEDGSVKNIRLIRIHLEEDAGKNIHTASDESYVDLNRAGTPLIEIVTYPDISSAYEAKAYLMRVHSIVKYLNISDANMDEGSFRADTNISVRKKGQKEFGTRVELKNINSFKFITQAIDYEVKRQIELIEDGGKVLQETRLWDTKKQESAAMRSKESAQDYRYFSEPDIPPIMIDEHWIEYLKKDLPELPHHKLVRFQDEYGLSKYETDILISDIELANFFEATVKLCHKPKQVTNWILRDLLSYLNENKLNLNQSRITPDTLAEFVNVLDQGIINTKVAQDVFSEMMESGKYPSIIIQEKDLKQIGSSEELEAVAREIISANSKIVEQYKAGNSKLFMFFVGQVMKATKGKGNPQMIQDILNKLLS